jgi:hypothetical protein
MALLANAVSLAEPGEHFAIQFLARIETERMDVIAGEMYSIFVKREFSTRRASTTRPTIRSRLRLTAAKLIRT